MIRKIAVHTWDVEDFGKKMRKARGLGQPVTERIFKSHPRGWFAADREGEFENLRNVENVCLIFNESATRALQWPLVMGRAWRLSALRNFDFPQGHNQKIIDAWKLYFLTLGAVTYLLHSLPNVRHWIFEAQEVSSEIEARSFGGISTDRMCIHNPTIQSLERVLHRSTSLRRSTVDVSVRIDERPGQCLRCLAPWTEQHYSPRYPLKICPGLGGSSEASEQQECDISLGWKLEKGQMLLGFGSGPPKVPVKAGGILLTSEVPGHIIRRNLQGDFVLYTQIRLKRCTE
jgi:hypothetical protein